MSEPEALSVEINGFSCRVWKKGRGRSSAFSPALADCRAGSRFSTRWRASARSSCRHCRVFPAASAATPCSTAISTGCWRCASCCRRPGSTAPIWPAARSAARLPPRSRRSGPAAVRRLALIAPWGLFDEKDPMTDPWAQRAPDVPGLLCADPERWNQLKAEPEGANSPEWPIEQTRANEAAARAFWPLGNTQARKAPAADRGADPADLGRRGPHHAAQLRRPLRRRDRRAHRNHARSPAPAISPSSTSPTRSLRRSCAGRPEKPSPTSPSGCSTLSCTAGEGGERSDG